jgi:hypothetical protein
MVFQCAQTIFDFKFHLEGPGAVLQQELPEQAQLYAPIQFFI